MTYIQELEERVETLQIALTEAESWVPRWNESEYCGWRFRSKYTNYGSIRRFEMSDIYEIWILGKSNVIQKSFKSIEEAKQYLENQIKTP